MKCNNCGAEVVGSRCLICGIGYDYVGDVRSDDEREWHLEKSRLIEKFGSYKKIPRRDKERLISIKYRHQKRDNS